MNKRKKKKQERQAHSDNEFSPEPKLKKSRNKKFKFSNFLNQSLIAFPIVLIIALNFYNETKYTRSVRQLNPRHEIKLGGRDITVITRSNYSYSNSKFDGINTYEQSVGEYDIKIRNSELLINETSYGQTEIDDQILLDLNTVKVNEKNRKKQERTKKSN